MGLEDLMDLGIVVVELVEGPIEVEVGDCVVEFAGDPTELLRLVAVEFGEYSELDLVCVKDLVLVAVEDPLDLKLVAVELVDSVYLELFAVERVLDKERVGGDEGGTDL